ncbi:hypothetical protein J2Z48_002174 [Croceifilum oryzae]|uniref:Uncharacterized protein n=1 Tax=Croceifilum oryzae TaxID=1553429 RepID=A0AAJ1TNF3_9BACL|nr:hypothetical protein [Croceifilum oryzae]MDQ0417990.1 hypothetical protein [Croceifilum oryzae]
MTPFLYIALSFASWAIYLILTLHMFYTWLKVRNNPKTLGLTVLASILPLLILIEVPKAFITNLYPESTNAEYQYKWEWTSDTHILDLGDHLRWFAETCTKISVHLVIIVFTLCLVLLWVTVVQMIQKALNIYTVDFTISKKAWKSLWIAFLSCIALYTVGWLSFLILIVGGCWLGRFLFRFR